MSSYILKGFCAQGIFKVDFNRRQRTSVINSFLVHTFYNLEQLN